MDEILARAVNNLKQARASGCWDHHQVYAFLNHREDVSAEEIRHLKGCLECRRMLLSAYPNQEWLDRVLE